VRKKRFLCSKWSSHCACTTGARTGNDWRDKSWSRQWLYPL